MRKFVVTKTHSRKNVFQTMFNDAKTIAFFSGKNINRFALIPDRTVLKEKKLRLIKVNNLILKKVLKNTKYRMLDCAINSYSLIAISPYSLNSAERLALTKLPYANIVLWAAICNNSLYSVGRILESAYMSSNFDTLAYTVLPTFMTAHILLPQFVAATLRTITAKSKRF